MLRKQNITVSDQESLDFMVGTNSPAPTSTTASKRPYRDPRVLLPRKEIVRLYKAGRSGVEVARELLISSYRVHKVIQEEGCVRTRGEGIRLAKLGVPRPKMAGVSLRCHPGEDSAPKWEILKLKAERRSTAEIAQQLKRSMPGIRKALCGLGFRDFSARSTSCYSFGEIFDKAALRELKQMSRLGVRELSQRSGVSERALTMQLYAGSHSKNLHLSTARQLVEWRMRLFSRLMGKASQSRVIRTFFPNLRQRYSLLLEILEQLRLELNRRPTWSRVELQNYLCQQAIREQAGVREGDLFRSFLPWAPKLIPFLDIEKLKGGGRLRPLALELIAQSLGTSPTIIGHAMAGATIPPEEMRALISETELEGELEEARRALASRGANGLGQAVAATKQKKNTGPKTGKKIGPELDQLEKQGFKWLAIRELMDAKTNTYRSIDAYQGLLKRWRARQQLLSREKPSN